MAQSVGIKDVARVAGVSVGTVSNVINRPDSVAEETRARVLSTIERLGYVRSESARHLRAGRSRIIALLVLDMANPFFVDVATGAERAARQSGLGVMLCNSAQSSSEEAEYLGLFSEQRVRGVLITPTDETGRNLESFRRQDIPYVFVDRVVPSTEGCSVSVDDVTGGALAMRHLLAQGHTDIAYVSGPLHLAQCRDRRAGALLALEEAGVRRPTGCGWWRRSGWTCRRGVTPGRGCWGCTAGRARCSARTTCWRSGCFSRCTGRGWRFRTRWRSWDTTTSSSRRPQLCH